MDLYLITTKGMCIKGHATVLAKSENHAKDIFKNSLDEELRDAYENQIINIKKIDLNAAQVIYYDDGDR